MQAGVKDKYIVSKGADNYVEVRYALQFRGQRLPKDMFDMYACVQMHKSTWRSMTYVNACEMARCALHVCEHA